MHRPEDISVEAGSGWGGVFKRLSALRNSTLNCQGHQVAREGYG